jgi:protein phosphatase
MIIMGKTDVGRKRNLNEDSFYADMIHGVYLAIVCDGVGGANGGEIASSIAVETFINTFSELAGSSVNYKDILIAAAARANDEIYSRAKSAKELTGMGTTIVACVFDKEEYHIINVGDSRLYLVGEGNSGMKQITRDHSLVQDLIDDGKLTKKEAEKYPNRNVITRALGIDDIVNADFYREKYTSGTILLCSDGLYNFVDDDCIQKYVSQYADLEHCMNQLIAKANENGGGDNITVVIMKPETPEVSDKSV